MRFLGHRFRADGGLDVEVEGLSKRRAVIEFGPDTLKATPNRLVAELLSAFEETRKQVDEET